MVVEDEGFNDWFKVWRKKVRGKGSGGEPVGAPLLVLFNSWVRLSSLDELADIVKERSEKEGSSSLLFG